MAGRLRREQVEDFSTPEIAVCFFFGKYIVIEEWIKVRAPGGIKGVKGEHLQVVKESKLTPTCIDLLVD